MTPQIQILLATYNGGNFLAQQLDSLFDQTVQDFEILARDDASSDDTLAVFAHYMERFPGRIRLLPVESRLGPALNFGTLLEHSRAPYIMFCDQDDLWHPDKIQRSLARMAQMEAQYGAGSPLLVFSDLEVVDYQMQPLAASFWKHLHMNPRSGSDLSRLLAQNIIAGCTMLLNRPLVDLSLPVPPTAFMHDAWIGLVCACIGRMDYLPETTVRYRQHQNNVWGAQPTWPPRLPRLLGRLLRRERREFIGQPMAAVLLERFDGRLNAGQRNALQVFANLHDQPGVVRRWQLVRYGFWQHGLIRNIGLLLEI